MKIFKTGKRAIIELDGTWYELPVENWDHFLNRTGLRARILEVLENLKPIKNDTITSLNQFDPPIGTQEVWAAGVTYLRSKVEREKESVESGGSKFYDRIYDAERPELFMKAAAYRAMGTGDQIYIRKDSSWNVPEPELTLFITSDASIEGYTVGNDLSSRSIEGENPLYLPQAKTWDGCAALGPCIYLPEAPLPSNTRISIQIIREDRIEFEGETHIDQMKRTFDELVDYLFRECSFPSGCFLMTGTGIVPPTDFSLRVGDVVRIFIDGIGELVNTIQMRN